MHEWHDFSSPLALFAPFRKEIFMTVVIRNAIAAAALAAIFAPAGFAQQTQTPSADQQRDERAKCEQLTGVARENCLDRLNTEKRERGTTNPDGRTQPSDLPKGPTPAPGTPR
jgi:hypothetical protein